MNDTAGILILMIGILFDVIGCIGLVRLPDIYNRLQAATKCVSLGTCLILVGAMITINSISGAFKCLLCLIAVIMTSPTAAHALARGAHRAGISLWEGSVVDTYREDQGRTS